MMTDLSSWLGAVIAFAVAMSATPGPNNVMVAASGATFGFRPTVPHILGIAFGFPAMFAVIALGASEPLRSLPWLHAALRWVGGAYMLWLAWHIAVAEPTVATGEGQARAQRRGRPLTFIQAALFQWVNPKAWIIAGGAVVTYLSGSGTAFYGQAAVVVAVLLVATLVFVSMWTGIGAGAARLLRTRRALRRFNLAMAGLLVLSLIPLVWE